MKTPVRLAIAAVVLVAAGAALYPAVAGMIGPKISPFGVSASFKPADFPSARAIAEGSGFYVVDVPEPNPAFASYTATYAQGDVLCLMAGHSNNLSVTEAQPLVEQLSALLDERYGPHQAEQRDGALVFRTWKPAGIENINLSLRPNQSDTNVAADLVYMFRPALDCLPKVSSPAAGL